MKKQIQNVLPRSAWDGVVIRENNEPVVAVEARVKLRKYKPEITLRKTVAEMLYQAADNLPDGYHLKVLEGVRTLDRQRSEWNRIRALLAQDNPSLETNELDRRTGLLVARPNPLANHNCGGAVDITIGFNGKSLDLGPYVGQENIDKRQVPMLSDVISAEQSNNRKILREAMESVEFVWYPGEWWHYCYGDRMWAVYTERKECFYGPLTFE